MQPRVHAKTCTCGHVYVCYVCMWPCVHALPVHAGVALPVSLSLSHHQAHFLSGVEIVPLHKSHGAHGGVLRACESGHPE